MSTGNPAYERYATVEHGWAKRIEREVSQKADQKDLDRVIEQLADLSRALITFSLSAVGIIITFALTVAVYVVFQHQGK